MSAEHENECVECKLCQIMAMPSDEREVKDTVLSETEHFEWIPGLGPFMEGYSLVVSKEHIANANHCPHPVACELDEVVIKAREATSQVYGENTVVFEHGSVGKLSNAGGCIDHLHIHIMPVTFVRVPEVLTKCFVDSQPINSRQESVGQFEHSVPYIYYSPRMSRHFAFQVDALPRQYLRQVVAYECGCPDDWDWRVKPFLDRINGFVKRITM